MASFTQAARGAINVGGRALEAVGLRAVPIEPARLLRRAQRRASLMDFGEFEYPDALEIACRCISDEMKPALFGRWLVREILTDQLVARLRYVELQRRHPGRFETPLDRPLIVLGLPRSGSTLLHRLLATAGDARALPLWQTREPFHVDGPDQRRNNTLRLIRVFRGLVPELDSKHYVQIDLPEEEVGFFDACLWTPTIWRFSPAFSYLDWFLEQDPGPGYALYARTLRWAQSETPDKRLVLKLPNHVGFMGALLDAVPEACVVQTHRDPVACVSSYTSLTSTVQQPIHAVDPHRIGAAALHMWGLHVSRGLRDRARHPGRVLDVYYDQLVEDPVGVVRRIYDHYGLPLTAEHERRMAEWLERRPQHRFGRHRYHPADFGLDAEDIRVVFRPYLQHFWPAAPA